MVRQFFDAVKNNSLDDCKRIIKLNGNLDINATRHGRTALHYAAMRGSVELIEYLITSGANVEAKRLRI